MGFFSRLIKLAITVTATVIDIALKTAEEIIKAVEEASVEYQLQRQKERLQDGFKIKEEAKDCLREVNNELLSILSKYGKAGKLSSSDQARAEYLKQRREELKQVINDADEISVVQEINNSPNAFSKLSLDNDHAHILQGQVGVSVFGKKCPNCGRDMLIQWPRALDSVSTADFFWGCSGWYFFGLNGQRLCSKTMRMSKSDLDIFTRTDSPESQVTNSELTELLLLPEPSDIVTERMDDLISDLSSQQRGANDYKCPIHGEELILRKKKQATGLLDQYFLGCPRWMSNDQGCTYLVKLKSPMQLATLLKKETGRGIL
jgi:hypothetical protein